jgi:hypothetical protein
MPPAGLKSRIVMYARVWPERGEPLGDTSECLGLIESTLTRWLRVDNKDFATGFGSASIVAAKDANMSSDA